jgi:predicted PurR-regulated permease PerM
MSKKIVLFILFSFWFFLISPFLGAVGMAAIFAVLFHPWMKKIDRGHFPNAIAAGLFTLGVTLVVFLPISTIMIVSVNSGLTELKRIKRLDPKAANAASSEVVIDKIFETSGFDSFLANTSKVLPMDPEKVSNQLKDVVSNISGRGVEALTTFIGHIPNMLVGFAVFLFALYYFLADGENFLLYED